LLAHRPRVEPRGISGTHEVIGQCIV